jgi:hypothetical protein
MGSAEHWTDAAGLAAQTVEFYQVQRFKVDAAGGEWVDVPDAQRAVELEAFDLVDDLAREFPATRYRVVRRFKGRT